MDEPQLILRGADALADTLRVVARAPRATALFCDIDGTVSPIVSDPYAAVVPEPFRAALAALAPRLGLLAFVTGRDVRQAAAMVGLEGATYVGLHGFDLHGSRRRRHARPRRAALRRRGAAHGAPRARPRRRATRPRRREQGPHARPALPPGGRPRRPRWPSSRPRYCGRRATLAWRWRPATSWSSCDRPWPIDKGTAVLSLLRSGAGDGARGAAHGHLPGRRPHRLHRLRRRPRVGGGRAAASPLAVAALTDETPPSGQRRRRRLGGGHARHLRGAHRAARGDPGLSPARSTRQPQPLARSSSRWRAGGST